MPRRNTFLQRAVFCKKKLIVLGDLLVIRVAETKGDFSEALKIVAWAYEFAQNRLENASLEEINQFVDKWIEDWSALGIYFNTGNRPNGNATNHAQMAFATEGCALDAYFGDVPNPPGDLVVQENHSVNHQTAVIFRDF